MMVGELLIGVVFIIRAAYWAALIIRERVTKPSASVAIPLGIALTSLAAGTSFLVGATIPGVRSSATVMGGLIVAIWAVSVVALRWKAKI
jgi:hypothetical protein